MLSTDDKAEAVFGAFDGVVSTVGVLVPLILVTAAEHLIVLSIIGLALNSGWSMGAGEYISDPRHRLRLAVVMGAATLLFTLLPAVPFFLTTNRILAAGFGAGILLACGALIAELRPEPTLASYRRTFAVLIPGVLLAAGWGLLAP